MLKGFKPIYLKNRHTIDNPLLLASSHTTTLNSASARIIGKPPYVIFLVNEIEKKLAFVSCKEEDMGAIRFKPDRNRGSVCLRHKAITKTIEDLMNWNLNENSYRINGEYNADENALIFDLKNSMKL